jgi:hypothetical protein
LELTTGVENIVSVPSPNTGRRNVISNSSGKTKTDRVIRETKIGDVLPWEDIADEAERLLGISKASLNAANEGHDDGEQENDQEVERDETHPYNEVISG